MHFMYVSGAYTYIFQTGSLRFYISYWQFIHTRSVHHHKYS
jgi:hypothetical protein